MREGNSRIDPWVQAHRGRRERSWAIGRCPCQDRESVGQSGRIETDARVALTMAQLRRQEAAQA